jgi:DNA end-binding protein Ku
VEWSPGDYHNTYRARVEELIARKRDGDAVVVESERPKSNVIDLMAALEASIAGAGPPGAKGTAAQAAAGPASHGGSGEPEDLAAMSKATLVARAAELDLPGRSKMTKPELISAITDAGPKRARKIS